jgi:hypothetical protein
MLMFRLTAAAIGLGIALAILYPFAMLIAISLLEVGVL